MPGALPRSLPRTDRPRSAPLVALGVAYTTLSAAAVPAVVAVLAVMLLGFHENGPQSQGSLGLAFILAVALGSVGGNAVIALLLAGCIAAVRPKLRHVVLTTFGLLAAVGGFFGVLQLSA